MATFDPNHFELWGGDSKQKIEECLNCKKPRCNNCYESTARGKAAASHYRAGYVQIDKYTGKVVAVYDTGYEAAEKTGLSRTAIYKAVCDAQKTAGGYIWKRKSEYEGEL